jgi:hypothetical protein
MSTQTIQVHNTWAPFFDGFGPQSILRPEPDLTAEHGEELNFADDFENARWEAAVIAKVFPLIKERIQEAVPEFDVTSIERKPGKVDTSIAIDVPLAPKLSRKLLRYVEAHLEDFEARLEHVYSNGPGFWSYHSTDPQEWIEATGGFTDFDGDTDVAAPGGRGHKLGALLKYVTEHYEDFYDGAGREHWQDQVYMARPSPLPFYSKE